MDWLTAHKTPIGEAIRTFVDFLNRHAQGFFDLVSTAGVACPLHVQASGLPPEKWSSLRYGFEPAGGREDGKEAAHGRRDRQQAAAGRLADGTGPTGSGGGPGDRGERGHLLPLAGGVRRAEGRPGQAPEGARG